MSAEAKLTVEFDGQTIKEHVLEDELDVGRSADCAIRLNDRAVSREHAVFRSSDDRVEVERKSQYGPMIVNGSEVTSAILESGDWVSIGPYLIRISIKAGDPPQPVATVIEDHDPSQPSIPEGQVPRAESPIQDLSAAKWDEQSKQASIDQMDELTQPTMEALQTPVDEATHSIEDIPDDLVGASIDSVSEEALSDPEPSGDISALMGAEDPSQAAGTLEALGEPSDSSIQLGGDESGGEDSGESSDVADLFAGSPKEEEPSQSADVLDLASLPDEQSSADSGSDFLASIGDHDDEDSSKADDGGGLELGDGSLDILGGNDQTDDKNAESSEAIASQGEASGELSLGEAPLELGGDLPDLGTGSSTAEAAQPSSPDPVDELDGELPSIELGGVKKHLDNEPETPDLVSFDPPPLTGESTADHTPPVFDHSRTLSRESDNKDIIGAEQQSETKIAARTELHPMLSIPEGSANITEIQLGDDEITIGRSKKCDIVIQGDKKVSRKNTIIYRKGARYVVKDLESSNGTYVNDQQVEERGLNSGDVVRVGAVEITFELKRKEIAPAGNLEEIPTVTTVDQPLPLDLAQGGTLGGVTETGASVELDIDFDEKIKAAKGLEQLKLRFLKAKKEFKEMPPLRRKLMILFIGGFLYTVLDSFDPGSQPKTQNEESQETEQIDTAAGDPELQRKFEALTPDQQRFVMNQRKLAFELFKKQEYDKALFEIRKIFDLIDNYKDAREIERYSIRAKERIDSIQAEQRKKQEKERIQAEVARLEQAIEKLMSEQDYQTVEELFTEVLKLDPENQKVGQWQQFIADYRESQRQLAEVRKARAIRNRAAKRVFERAQALRDQQKFYLALKEFKKVYANSPTDKSLLEDTGTAIKEVMAEMDALIQPLIEEANGLIEGGQHAEAFKKLEAVTKIDPGYKEAYRRMDQIRAVLHDQAKVLYTEAVLAESYSDFELAKQKYKEVLNVAPKADVFHGRATRKLKRLLPLKIKETSL